GPCLFEAAPIEALEPRDLAILVGDQCRPVEFAFADTPAITRRILEVLGKLRGIDEQLLGHAATDHACAAEAIFLGDRHALAHRRGKAARANPAGAAANDKKVVVEFGHWRAPARLRMRFT